ncbi:Receptor-type tyrosine-protein phosphatase gamma, partial [Larimichthys crocea]
AVLLKDDYFVRGAGLPGRFKAEKMEFHWGHSNGSAGSEHSINGRRFPVEMQIYLYNSDDFDSLSAAIKERRIISAMAVFFELGQKDNPAVDPIIQGLKGVVHHGHNSSWHDVLNECCCAGFTACMTYADHKQMSKHDCVISLHLGTQPALFTRTRMIRFTTCHWRSLCEHKHTLTGTCKWMRMYRHIAPSEYRDLARLEAFYSIFTTEQQDHVKSVEYLRNNFRPLQDLNNRKVFKSACERCMAERFNGDVCSSAPVNMKIQPVNQTALMVSWERPLTVYHPPITSYMVSYSWVKRDVADEKTFTKTGDQSMKAVITNVSPDVLYLFRVQAVCQHDLRSDFSQTLLFRANTTRIFEGSRIVKTGMPTISPASSADMAPISSGSSTWTSSGIHFSIVSMATGMGPSSSGSQATVASVVTSTLLAGLGVGGGVISSLPSSVWPTQAPQATQNPTRPSAPPAKSSTEQAAPQGSDTDTPSEEKQAAHEGKEEEEEGEKEEEQEDGEVEKKKKNKTAPDNEEKQANSTVVKEPLIPTPASTAKEKGEEKPTVKGTTVPASTRDDQLVHVEKPTDVNAISTQEPRNDSAEMQIPQSSTLPPFIVDGKGIWPFSVHTDRTVLSNVTRAPHPGMGRMVWIVPLVVVSALTLLCLIMLLIVMVYWRRFFQTAHFYVEESNSPRVVANENIPVIPIPDDMEAIPVKHFVKHIMELYKNNLQGFSEEFEEVQRSTADLKITAEHSNHPDNKHKNRYINIVAYDHSRVKLRALAGKDAKHSDYINANYVDGYNRPRAYIAAQGPLKSTFEDFWRMVWEQNTGIIIMITNLVEKGRDDYVLEVRHFQCPKWPNPDAPLSSTFELISVIKEEAMTRDGPTIVHDEYGAVSAGMLCALTTLSQQLENEGVVDIYQVAKMINLMRPGVFTDIEQYQYLYKAMLSLVGNRECGLSPMHMDTNGVVVIADESDPAESMESLV